MYYHWFTRRIHPHRQMSKIGSMSAGDLRTLAWARLGATIRGAGSGRPGAQLMGEGASGRTAAKYRNVSGFRWTAGYLQGR
jgi:hypothetical protein